MLKYTDQWGYMNVYVTYYIDGEYDLVHLPPPLWTHGLYDEALLPVLLEHAPDKINAITYGVLHHLLDQQFTLEELTDSDIWDIGLDQPTYVSISKYAGHPNDLKVKANDQLDYMMTQAQHVSGDDDYFDYFPDLCGTVMQLCEALDMHADYKLAWRYIIDNFYKDLEPDVLPAIDLDDHNYARQLVGLPPALSEREELQQLIQDMHTHLDGDIENGPRIPTENEVAELRYLQSRLERLTNMILKETE